MGASMAVLAALIATPAAAQTETAAASGGLEDIVVTARKVAENLQDVPVAVTAFTGEALTNKGVFDVRGIADFTSGLTTREASNNPTAFIIALRGQVQTDTLATLEPSVGVYLDGMYIARAYGLNTELLDIASVQVLKGPQGTLFGRNTTGGAILLQTSDPVIGEFSGLVSGTYGRYNEVFGTGIINVPLGDRAAVRGALQYSQRDSWMRDIKTGAEFGRRESLQGRVKFLWEPTDNFRLLASGEWFDGKLDLPARINRFTGNTWTGVAGTTAAAERAIFERDVNAVAQTPVLATAGADVRAPSYNDVKTQTYGLTAALDTFFGEIKWINGYRKIEGDNQIDLDGTSVNRHVTQGTQELEQYSTEFQVTGTALADAVTFAAGATYFKEKGFDKSRSNNNGAPTWTQFNGIIDNDSFGLYSQATWRATEKFSITGGLRYSVDDKRVTSQSGVFLFNTTLIVCLPTNVSPAINACKRSRSDTFDDLSYTIGADYRFSDDVLVYAKYGRGYRSGAQQLRSLQLTDTAPAQPEIVKELEIGLKSDWFDRRLRLNVAGFYNTITGAQRSTLQAVPPNPAQTLLENADVRNFGLEADLAWAITDGLTFSASGSLLDPKYESYVGFVNGVAGVDKSSARFDGLANQQFALGLDYRGDVGFARLVANVNYTWVGEMPLNPESFQTLTASGYTPAQANQIIAATTKEAAGFMNARLGLRFGADDNFEVALWGRNIFDKRIFDGGLFVGGANDYVSGLRNDPATYGITATFRFGN
jgi:iron complex outermembrane receptor protein